MAKIEYTELIEQYGAIGFEKQHSLFDIIGNSDWGVDLNTSLLSFSNGEEFRIQVAGSYSYDSETWLWAWANTQSNIKEDLLEDVKKLRAFGEVHQHALLTTPQFDCSTTDLHAIGMLSSSIANASAYYCGDFGEGIIVLLIHSDAIDSRPYNEQARISTTLSSLISAYEVNHKNAFTHYLTTKGYTLKEDGDKMGAKKDDKIIEATFDSLNRMTNINQEIK